jgi:hypothetical protein
VPPPPPDAAATSPRQPQEQQEQEEEQKEEQQQPQQQPPERQELQQPRHHSRFATSDMDCWTMPQNQYYQRYISGVMSFFHDTQYLNDKTFTRTELLELTTINNNIRCFGGTIEGSILIQQANNGGRLRRLGEALPAEGNAAFISTLSPNPRSLRELWLEYKFGIDGRKPAEQFTTREKNASRRKLKQMYYRRNVFWKCMGELIRGGETVDTATMKIRQCYGQQLSVTATINKMIADRKNGGHPNLR